MPIPRELTGDQDLIRGKRKDRHAAAAPVLPVSAGQRGGQPTLLAARSVPAQCASAVLRIRARDETGSSAASASIWNSPRCCFLTDPATTEKALFRCSELTTSCSMASLSGPNRKTTNDST